MTLIFDEEYEELGFVQEHEKIPVTLESEKYEQFAEWVAKEIFDDMWDYNKDAFAEIACRKLEKLGIVKANGNMWELIKGA